MHSSIGIRWFVLTVLAVAICTVMVVTPLVAQQAEVKKVPATRTPAYSGEQMFKSYCASCHGIDGKGNGPAASALKVSPGDLTRVAKANGGTFPELKVLSSISGDSNLAAHGSKDMPVWGTVFREMGGSSDSQLRLRNLTRYIESIQVK